MTNTEKFLRMYRATKEFYNRHKDEIKEEVGKIFIIDECKKGEIINQVIALGYNNVECNREHRLGLLEEESIPLNRYRSRYRFIVPPRELIKTGLINEDDVPEQVEEAQPEDIDVPNPFLIYRQN